MRTRRKLLLAVLAPLAVLALLVFLLSVVSLNAARSWIGARVSEATGRDFSINGDLALHWQRPQAQSHGWRRFVPWPHLRGHDVRLSNPEWATSGPQMLEVRQLDFSLNPFSLFAKTVRVPSLVLTQAQLRLEIDEDGRNNWTFREPEDEEESGWKLDLQDLTLVDSTVRLVHQGRKADVTARLDTLDGGGMRWQLSGKVDEDEVSGGGIAGSLLSLREQGAAYPFEAVLKVGSSELSASGTVSDPQKPTAIDLQLKIQGASMAELFPFSGLVLPSTPKFSTEGRLVGSLKPEDFHLRYEKFSGKVGASDLAGTLEYRRGEERAVLRGSVVSERLDLSDLGAVVATGSEDKQENRDKDKTPQPEGKVLPVGEFRTERWNTLDAQVEFSGKRIVRQGALPVEDLYVKVDLDDGVLKLAPLNFGVAGGKFRSALTVEGNVSPAVGRLSINARGLRLSRLFPQVEEMKASLGQLHLNAELSGTGNSFAALAASANGEARAFVSEGTISKFILEAAGLNIGSVIVTQLFGDHQVQLHCLASDFAVKDGVMQARTFVLDTEDALIAVDGQVHLGREQLALTIRPQSKGVRVFSLRSPLYVRGSFKEPDVGIDKAAVGAKAAAAAALGVAASPLAALLALVNPGPEEESPCPALLARAKEKPEAPEVEKSR